MKLFPDGEVCQAVAYGIKTKSTPVLVCCVDCSDAQDRHAAVVKSAFGGCHPDKWQPLSFYASKITAPS